MIVCEDVLRPFMFELCVITELLGPIRILNPSTSGSVGWLSVLVFASYAILKRLPTITDFGAEAMNDTSSAKAVHIVDKINNVDINMMGMNNSSNNNFVSSNQGVRERVINRTFVHDVPQE
mgnify:CR=1 FL=1